MYSCEPSTIFGTEFAACDGLIAMTLLKPPSVKEADQVHGFPPEQVTVSGWGKDDHKVSAMAPIAKIEQHIRINSQIMLYLFNVFIITI